MGLDEAEGLPSNCTRRKHELWGGGAVMATYTTGMRFSSQR